MTSRDNVVIPGSSTRFSISHSTARSNSSRRESRVMATREATNAVTSASAVGEVPEPQQIPDLPRVLVPGLHPLRVRLHHDGSSMPSCSAA